MLWKYAQRVAFASNTFPQEREFATVLHQMFDTESTFASFNLERFHALWEIMWRILRGKCDRSIFNIYHCHSAVLSAVTQSRTSVELNWPVVASRMTVLLHQYLRTRSASINDRAK